jgi:CSLREA domain-containing protein
MRRAVLGALGLALAVAAPAAADTYTVNTTADDGSGCANGPPGHPCTLRGAVSEASDNAPGTVIVPAGTYVLNSALLLGGGTTVVGDSARTTIVDGNGAVTNDRTFLFAVPGAVTLSHLTITGGRPDGSQYGGSLGGNVFVQGGALTLDHVRVAGGSASSVGGVADDGGSLTIDHSLIASNNALTGDSAGGVGSSGAGASVTITNSTLARNGGASAGALDVAVGEATLSHVTIAGNRSTGSAPGGIRAAAGTSFSAHATIVAGNLQNTGPALSDPGSPSNCSGPLPDAGANVESGSDCGLADPTSRQNADAALGGLSNQGGETDVFPLGDASAARDLVPTGGCPATDQRDASRPRGPACDAGAFEADVLPPPPPPPPPPPAHEHSLHGFVSYEPAFALGVVTEVSVNPFTLMPAPSLEVLLKSATGDVVAEQRLSSAPTAIGRPEYRFDGLRACSGCQVVLGTTDGVVQYAQPVSFDGEPGETTVRLLMRPQPGTLVSGTVSAPGRAVPTTLRVRIRDVESGKTLADTATLNPQCSSGSTRSGATCATSDEYRYRLAGLAHSGQEVVVELLQRRPGGPVVVVDSWTGVLAPDGQESAGVPLLTALDALPSGIQGRTLFGTVGYLGAFAPGRERAQRQSLRYAPGKQQATVQLRKGSRVVATGSVTTPSQGESTYRLSGLPTCASCTVELLNGPGVVDHAAVALPSGAATTVTRRDLELRGGRGNQLAGVIARGDISPPSRLRVTVRKGDAHGPLLADSNDLTPPCPGRSLFTSDHCDIGVLPIYRLGGIPADTSVTVALLVRGSSGWAAVDSRVITTDGPDQDTNVPELFVPQGYRGVPIGRQLFGLVDPGGGFAPGALPTLSPTDHFIVRLVDPGGAVRASTSSLVPSTTSIGSLAWAMNGVPACPGCVLELIKGPEVQDRVPQSVANESPSVASAQRLRDRFLPFAEYVEGVVTARHPSAPLNDLEMQILGPNGKPVGSTADPGVHKPNCGARNNPCGRVYSASYRIPKAPSSGTVTVVAIDHRTHRELAREQVTIAGTGSTTAAPITLKPEP